MIKKEDRYVEYEGKKLHIVASELSKPLTREQLKGIIKLEDLNDKI